MPLSHQERLEVEGLFGLFSLRKHCSKNNTPLRIRLYVLRKGFPRSNPMTWGWDVSTTNPTNFGEGSGFLGLSCSRRFPECSNENQLGGVNQDHRSSHRDLTWV